MSPCINACGSGESGLSWLDGNGECAACRPELAREPIPYLHQNRPPLIPLREMAAVNRDNPFRPPAVAVEPLTPVPVGAETPETITEPLRAIKPPAAVVHLDAQTAAGELAEAEQIGATTVRPLLGDALRAFGPAWTGDFLGFPVRVDATVPDDVIRIEGLNGEIVSEIRVASESGHPTGQTNPPIARSRWSRVWARLLRRTA